VPYRAGLYRQQRLSTLFLQTGAAEKNGNFFAEGGKTITFTKDLIAL